MVEAMCVKLRSEGRPLYLTIHLPVLPAVVAFLLSKSCGYTLSGYGPMFYGNRQVRTRLLGGVGAGGEKPPATRLAKSLPTFTIPWPLDNTWKGNHLFLHL